tara:strand:- start:113360 stop:113683 length:324 start_codon:yes stop_codon:yes gene_type:complete
MNLHAPTPFISESDHQFSQSGDRDKTISGKVNFYSASAFMRSAGSSLELILLCPYSGKFSRIAPPFLCRFGSQKCTLIAPFQAKSERSIGCSVFLNKRALKLNSAEL